MRGTSSDISKIFHSNKSIWLPWQAVLLPGASRSTRCSKSPNKTRTKSAKSISPCKSKVENRKPNYTNAKLYRSLSSLSINQMNRSIFNVQNKFKLYKIQFKRG